MQELSDQAGAEFDNTNIRWVITVPAIWKMPAKQFMREAAYKVGGPLSMNPHPCAHACSHTGRHMRSCMHIHAHCKVECQIFLVSNDCLSAVVCFQQLK